MVFAIEDSPVYMIGAFDLMTWMTESKDQVQAVFPTGGGVPWSDHTSCFFCAVARFFRPGYHNNLVSTWLPALDGVVDKLQRGAKVADVGCGHGWSTVLMAKAFPKSQFIGYDFHPSSIEQAAAHAREHGVTANTRFEVATAKGYPEKDLDLVAFFDCLHDMGDPASASAHVRQSLKPDGAWMIVEPMAGDKLEDNLNPVGRIYYAGSTMGCVPTSLAGGRGSTWRASRRGAPARGHHRRRVPQCPPRRGDAVQHDPRSAPVIPRTQTCAGKRPCPLRSHSCHGCNGCSAPFRRRSAMGHIRPFEQGRQAEPRVRSGVWGTLR